uniref:Uncharacterized protein n=1 Tax=Zea mays TaxID=4577 RepID=B4FPC1_MAIZE|nr:unknown [Zea mays]
MGIQLRFRLSPSAVVSPPRATCVPLPFLRFDGQATCWPRMALRPAKHPSSLSPGGPAPRRLYRARSARSPPIGNRCTLPQLL